MTITELAQAMEWCIPCPDCDSGRTWVAEYEGDTSPCTRCKWAEPQSALAEAFADNMLAKYSYRNCSKDLFVNLYAKLVR